MNELTKVNTSSPTVNNNISLNGRDSKYIENISKVDNMDNSTNIIYPYYILNNNQLKKQISLPEFINTKYYNFIVSTNINNDATLNNFSLPITKVINNCSNIENKYELAKLDDYALKNLYSYPTIFAPEAIEYDGKTGDDQMCFLGFIQKVKSTRKDVNITSNYLWKFPYKCIENLASVLDIKDMDIKITELNNTHWSVKELDLFGTLSNYGVSLLGLYSQEANNE